MANCICVSYGGKGHTLHGACPVHGPQPALAEDAERSKLALDLATAALNALPHEIRQRMNDMAKAHHVLIVAAIERVLAERSAAVEELLAAAEVPKELREYIGLTVPRSEVRRWYRRLRAAITRVRGMKP